MQWQRAGQLRAVNLEIRGSTEASHDGSRSGQIRLPLMIPMLALAILLLSEAASSQRKQPVDPSGWTSRRRHPDWHDEDNRSEVASSDLGAGEEWVVGAGVRRVARDHADNALLVAQSVAAWLNALNRPRAGRSRGAPSGRFSRRGTDCAI